MHAQCMRAANQLRGRCLEYMVPSAFVGAGVATLTANGKLIGCIPAPTKDSYARQNVSPPGDLEIALAEIWQELLRVEGGPQG